MPIDDYFYRQRNPFVTEQQVSLIPPFIKVGEVVTIQPVSFIVCSMVDISGNNANGGSFQPKDEFNTLIVRVCPMRFWFHFTWDGSVYQIDGSKGYRARRLINE